MQITDPVADMLTRIRNANSAKHDTVDVPASNLKKAIAQILLAADELQRLSPIVRRIKLRSIIKGASVMRTAGLSHIGSRDDRAGAAASAASSTSAAAASAGMLLFVLFLMICTAVSFLVMMMVTVCSG